MDTFVILNSIMSQKHPVDINEIMNFIDDERLSELGAMYSVDKPNHKLTGRFMLKAFILGSFAGYPMSLRVIKEISNVAEYLKLELNTKNELKRSIDHSTVSKRLKTVNVNFFKAVYEEYVYVFNRDYSSKINDQFQRFDSTLITLSSKLLKSGLNLGTAKDYRQIKVSICLSNSIPASMRFCKRQTDGSEDVALHQAIKEAKLPKEQILLFDRGVRSRKVYENLINEKRLFITRANTGCRYNLIKSNKVNSKANAEGLIILSDEIVQLYDHGKTPLNYKVRLIKAKNKNEAEIVFLTNIFNLNAQDIASGYKKRWEIEVFFKFLKQHLQFNQFVSYDMNGMEVYLYCLLIACILFMMYKIRNNLKGFKIPLVRFALELQKSIAQDGIRIRSGQVHPPPASSSTIASF